MNIKNINFLPMKTPEFTNATILNTKTYKSFPKDKIITNNKTDKSKNTPFSHNDPKNFITKINSKLKTAKSALVEWLDSLITPRGRMAHYRFIKTYETSKQLGSNLNTAVTNFKKSINL